MGACSLLEVGTSLLLIPCDTEPPLAAIVLPNWCLAVVVGGGVSRSTGLGGHFIAACLISMYLCTCSCLWLRRGRVGRRNLIRPLADVERLHSSVEVILREVKAPL